jgi:SAM-dependent methyltransferase
MGQAKHKKTVAPVALKLDLGCGKNKREGFIGVDCRKFDGVDQVADLTKPWPWADNSVSVAHSSHFIEHLTAEQRIHFVNELYRVLVPGGTCSLIAPHWASCRAYGDLTHQWPPVSEFWFYYLNKDWRLGTEANKFKDANAPHNDGYTCDFDAQWGYGMRPELMGRNPEYQQYAMVNYKEAISDIHCTLTKKVPSAK